MELEAEVAKLKEENHELEKKQVRYQLRNYQFLNKYDLSDRSI